MNRNYTNFDKAMGQAVASKIAAENSYAAGATATEDAGKYRDANTCCVEPTPIPAARRVAEENAASDEWQVRRLQAILDRVRGGQPEVSDVKVTGQPLGHVPCLMEILHVQQEHAKRIAHLIEQLEAFV